MKLLFLLQEKPQIGAESESRQRKCPLMGDLIPDLSPTTPLQMSSTSPSCQGQRAPELSSFPCWVEMIFSVEFLHFVNWELLCQAKGWEDVPSPSLGTAAQPGRCQLRDQLLQGHGITCRKQNWSDKILTLKTKF